MIFFGTKAKIVAGDMVGGVKCPNCDSDQFRSFGLQKYFHLYWIPTFPTGKSVGLECANCKHALVDGDVPAQVESELRDRVFSAKSSLPLFTGSIIIVILVGFLWNSIRQDEANEALWFANPQVGDYWVVDYTKIYEDVDPEYPYGAMRISELTDERAYFDVSTIAYTKPMGVQDDIRDGAAADASYYDEEGTYFGYEELKLLRDTRAIYSIERD